MGVVVVAGGTNGMGRALALGRAERGDQVVVLGRNRERGEAMAGGPVTFRPVDLSSVAETRQAIEQILTDHPVVDALTLFANGLSPRRTATAEGFERTFALYYLSRNDLLGVGFAERSGSRARYVLYHPGFTRSGDRSSLPRVFRGLLAVASIAAQPIADAVSPIHQFLDAPPSAPLTAIDRGKFLPPTFPTLDPRNADRLMDLTEELLE